MSEKLTRPQQILMWELFAAGGERLNKDIVPKPEAKDRQALVGRGFVKVQDFERTKKIELEDGGWRWIADTDPFPIAQDEKRVTAERRLLQSLMRSIKRYAANNKMPIQTLFREGGNTGDVDGDANPDEASVEDAVRSAFFEVAGRPARDNVRLSTLRLKLSNISRSDLDATLLAMRKAGTANLMNLDNPRDIQAEGDAALRAGAQTFHVVWITE